MTDMSKICESHVQDSLKYVWLFLDEKRGTKVSRMIDDYENYHTLTLASFMYLLKKDALRIKHNANGEKEHIILRIDANFINKVDPEMLKKWKDNGFETLDFCSILPANDPLYEIITRNLSKLQDKGTERKVIDFMKDIVTGNINPSQFLDILDKVFRYDRKSKSYRQPKELAALAEKILDIKGKSIFNPFSGTMPFAFELREYTQYSGIETNCEISEYAKIRLALADMTDNVSADCRKIETWTDKKYDIIVTIPPFNEWIRMEDAHAVDSENAPSIAIRRFEDTTTDEGQLLAFVGPALLTDSRYDALRKEITTKNYLDAVINLPMGALPYTAAQASIVVLKKNRNANASIKMIDASQMFISEKPCVINVDEIVKAYKGDTGSTLNVSRDDIAAKLYSWDASYYIATASEKFREGYDIKSLAEILIPVSGNEDFLETEGKRVTVSTIPSDWTEYILHVDCIAVSDSLRNTRKITSPVVLFSMIGRDIKMAYCEASEKEPIFIKPYVTAYSIANPNIHAGYLCMKLCRKIHENPHINTHINEKSFALAKIDFPPLSNPTSYDEQANLYEEVKSAVLMYKDRELGLQDSLVQTKAEYVNEVRARKHDMMPHLRQLSSAQKNLEYYLSDSSKQMPIFAMQKEVQNQAKAIEALSNILTIFSRESQFGEPEAIDIYDYFIFNYPDGDDYIVDYIPDYWPLKDYGFEDAGKYEDGDYEGINRMIIDGWCGWYKFKGTNVFMAKDDLKRLCDNILNNAIQHGFTNSDEDCCTFEIYLTINPKLDMFEIRFTNNGNPLPKGMDNVRYGLRGEKAGPNGGSGEGGYIVKSIVEHYGGFYDIFSNNSGETVVVIDLPIYREQK